MKIVVDAMGGDNAPVDIVKGCIDAINEARGFEVLLVGDKNKIEDILLKNNFNSERLKIVHSSEVILNDDIPTKAIKNKKGSSMVMGLNMLKNKEGNIFISAGNTGALMAGSLFILGRIEGVDRPALVSILPTKKGPVMLLDSGANTSCKAINYVQFGIMGSCYMKGVFDIDLPRVGLINVGTESKKGNEIIKQAYLALSETDINFIGNIEGREIMDGNADVVVCDGFLGNVLLKFLEGLANFFSSEIKSIFMRNLLTKISAVIMKKGLSAFKKKLDYAEYGGAPFLGIKEKVIKCHGSSNAKAIKFAIIKSVNYAKSNIIEQFSKQLKNVEVDKIAK